MAMQQVTSTPERDELVGILETFIDDAYESLDGFCADCRAMLEDRCDDHARYQRIVDRYQPIVLKLYQARTDDEAKALVDGLGEPAVTEFLRETEARKERVA